MGKLEIKIESVANEFKLMCDLMYNTQNPTLCNQRIETPSTASKNQGLYNYSLGILQGKSDYTYREAEYLFSAKMGRSLLAKTALVGTNNPQACQGRTCPDVNQVRTAFDSTDDITNLNASMESLAWIYNAGIPNTKYIFNTYTTTSCTTFNTHNLLLAPASKLVNSALDIYRN